MDTVAAKTQGRRDKKKRKNYHGIDHYFGFHGDVDLFRSLSDNDVVSKNAQPYFSLRVFGNASGMSPPIAWTPEHGSSS